MYIHNNRPGQCPFETKIVRVVNRGGATALVIGDVMAFDLDDADAATQALAGVGGITLATLAEAVWHNIIHVAAAPANAIVCAVQSLLSGAGADNTEVAVAVSGPCRVKVGGTNWSSARSSCGVACMADITGANRRLILATDAANRAKNGLILDNIATDLSAANTVANIMLFGWGGSVGTVGA